MPNFLFKPPKDLVDEWPEVFGDLYMNTMPINYLKIIKIEFLTGMVWEVDIQTQIKIHGPDTVANLLDTTFNEKIKEVKQLSFELDTKKLKNDVIKLTKKLL